VEVYFPGYGWIPFEATPDGINLPVNRPNTAAELNSAPVTAVVPSARPRPNLADAPVPQGGGGGARLSNVTEPLLIAGAVAVLLLLLTAAAAVRWLFMVSDMPRIWRRLQFLADRLRVPRHQGDTPEEFGRRLAGSVPDLDRELRSLARLYTRGTFRRGGLDPAEAAQALKSWSRVRQNYPGLVARAWRDALLRGQVVRAAGGERSRSRGRGARR
jgi:hypothetical protein